MKCHKGYWTDNMSATDLRADEMIIVDVLVRCKGVEQILNLAA
jgi:hypothetical protein